MTFLTSLGVTEILCSFGLVIEGKIGKKIPESLRLEVFKNFSANSFALSDEEDNTSGPFNRVGNEIYFFEKTIRNSPKVLRAKFLESDGLFSFISMCKFHSFKNLFATVTSLSEL